MESKETKQSFTLVVKEDVVSYTEISEKIELEHMGETKLLWQHSTFILHDFEDSFLQKKNLEMKVFNSSSSYHLLWTQT